MKQINFKTESNVQCGNKWLCVLGARVDDIAVLTVQCDAQQLFLAMTGSRKKDGFYRLHWQFIFLIFCFFVLHQVNTARGIEVNGMYEV
jgi:hypothetical protein